ncbi:MAG: class I SAM-dependent methyltransferase [Planctomycetes bacterium]|nr:class I SAM-dependent methyltransferase [Planctomycetota bacterium]
MRDIRALCDVVRRSEGRAPLVLDLGCGVGERTCDFLEEGAWVTALDLSEERLDRLLGRLDDPRWQSRCVLVRKDAAAYLEEIAAGMSSRFDVVAVGSLLRGVSDLPSFMESIASVLRPGGYLYLADLPLGAGDLERGGAARGVVHGAVGILDGILRCALRGAASGPSTDVRAGVSPREVRDAAGLAGLRELFLGKRNRRATAFASHLENDLLGALRPDRPGATRFTQCFRRGVA